MRLDRLACGIKPRFPRTKLRRRPQSGRTSTNAENDQTNQMQPRALCHDGASLEEGGLPGKTNDPI